MQPHDTKGRPPSGRSPGRVSTCRTPLTVSDFGVRHVRSRGKPDQDSEASLKARERVAHAFRIVLNGGPKRHIHILDSGSKAQDKAGFKAI